MEWNYRENHTHGIHFGDKSPLRCKIGLSATHIQDPKFIVTFLVNPSGAYGRSPSGPAALWVAARRPREGARKGARLRAREHARTAAGRNDPLSLYSRFPDLQIRNSLKIGVIGCQIGQLVSFHYCKMSGIHS